METKLYFVPKSSSSPSIKVIGVGGGGNNAVAYMHQQGILGVDFIVCNTDAQALDNNIVKNRIQLGSSITEGLGAGANPEIGEKAAIESIEDIKSYLEKDNTKMLFITAGMGGGTGTGAAPIIAECAKNLGILTVAIVTVPFSFEGKQRIEQAKEGIDKIRNNVDSLIIVKNDKLRELYGNLGYKTGFSKSNEVLSTAVRGIAEVITKNYSINIDLKDARTVLADSGTAIMGSAITSGPERAKEAILQALDSPLLNDNQIKGAKNVLLLIVSGLDEITMDEIAIIHEHIQNESGNRVNIIMGMGEDEELDGISVTVIATGFSCDSSVNKEEESEPIVISLKDDNHVDSFSIKEELNVISDQKNKENTFGESLTLFDIDTCEKDFNVVPLEINEEKGSNNSINDYANKSLEIKTEDFEDLDIRVIEDNTIDSEDSLEKKNRIIDNNVEEQLNEESKHEEINSNIFNINEKNQYSSFVSISDIKNQDSQINSIDDSKESNEKLVKVSQERQMFNQQELNPTVDNQRAIEERRERLKKLNSRIKNISESNIRELQNTPAYKRKGINIFDNEESSSLTTFFDRDKNKVNIKPNNFFKDNVD